MTETSAPWNGTSTGDASAAPYDAPTEWAEVWRSLAGASRIPTNLGGVITGELNELAVSGTSSPVSVATGAALAYGTRYENDAAASVAVPTPSGATRIDRIVLRKDWTAQTVRITRIEGVEGGSAPALVQVAGTTWDTPLAQVSITTGGVITCTSQREFVNTGWEQRRKRSDQTVNNSTTLVNDTDLLFPVQASKRYAVRGILFFNGNESADLDATWSLPAGAEFRLKAERQFDDVDAVTTTAWTQEETFAAGDPALGNTRIHFEGEIVTGVTAGTAQLQWAQNVLNASDMKMLAGSFVEFLAP